MALCIYNTTEFHPHIRQYMSTILSEYLTIG